MGSDILQEVPMYKNNEGYQDPTAGRAIRKADKPPEEVINFRRALKKVVCDLSCADPGQGNRDR